jgi:hypothetical protein
MTSLKAFLFFAAFFSLQLQAQITITSDDMPVPGDTVRKSNTILVDTAVFLLSGPGQTWLFDDLTVMSQQVDTFLSVSETPAMYQFFFNNQFIYPDYKATVAQKLAQFTGIPGLTLTDAYLFIKNTDEEIREVGYGVTLDGVAIPIQLQEIDTIYRFPLEYGNIDSSHALLQVDVPDLGYLMMSKSRSNIVDGWGTLITPYGEFQTLRVKTQIVEYDSLYSDSLGIGMPVIRNITEYKWLANGYPEPLLQINREGLGITASYIDSLRTSFLSIPDYKSRDLDFSVYPNPCHGHLTVEYELFDDADVMISIYSAYGDEIKRFQHGKQDKGYYNQVLYLKENGFRPGIYFLRLTIDHYPMVKKLIIE